MKIDRKWVERNLGFDPIERPAPDSTFTIPGAARSGGVEDLPREIIDFDSEGPEGREFLAFTTATGLPRFTDVPWPSKLKPIVDGTARTGSAGELPNADVLVVTWTKEWLDFANDRIFEPQINVRFKYLRTRPITIDEDLGNKINLRSIGLLPYVKRDDEAGRIWHKITDFGMLEPQVFNVFCVWNFDNDGDEGRSLAAFVASKVRITAKEMQEAGANYNMCVMKETNMEDDEKCGICNRYIFAHEAGHYLARFPYHTSNDDLLMTPGALGSRLLRSDADKMNPTNS